VLTMRCGPGSCRAGLNRPPPARATHIPHLRSRRRSTASGSHERCSITCDANSRSRLTRSIGIARRGSSSARASGWAGTWAIDELDNLLYSAVLFPRSRTIDDDRNAVYLSPRGGFGLYLSSPRDPAVQPGPAEARRPGAHHRRAAGGTAAARAAHPGGRAGRLGSRLSAFRRRRCAGSQVTARRAFHDQIRVPQAPPEGRRTNPFFIDLYRTIADGGQGIEAREHTAQVTAEQRQERESEFRSGKLPLLFCSPTMELGVDIASFERRQPPQRSADPR